MRSTDTETVEGRELPSQNSLPEVVILVKIELLRLVDTGQPGWVEGQLMDAQGQIWQFREKHPVLAAGSDDPLGAYPQPGVLAGVLVKRWCDSQGREGVTIDTTKPWGIADENGRTHFDVFLDQLVGDLPR